MSTEYTLVLGLDAAHLAQLAISWPTWMRHKPDLRECPVVIFYDHCQVTVSDIRNVIRDRPASLAAWPLPGCEYAEISSAGRFGGAQRHKMLAGFVHIPAAFVKTPYWLKLDTDVVATGVADWVKPRWFEFPAPAIVAHRWGYTKPPNQMAVLDDWAGKCDLWPHSKSLCLSPADGDASVHHERIISWCGLFNTGFSRECSLIASETCGQMQLPVPSQDGYMWYCAKRENLVVTRVNMKRLGWKHCNGIDAVRSAAEEAMRV